MSERVRDRVLEEIVEALDGEHNADEINASTCSVSVEEMRNMATELQERRAADLTPANADALQFALGAVHFYAGSVGCSATSKEIKSARDIIEKLLHGRHP